MSKLKDAVKNVELKSKYLSEGDIQTLARLKKALQEKKVVVTCMGLYNHGKSTLLNTLIGDFEHKTFKTADVRETSINKTVAHGAIIFVDTPGLNSQKHDDKRVMDAAKQSDINIFVHTVTTGEFTEKEIEFFGDILKNWKDPKEFIKRTIFVVSRIDKANCEADIINAIDKMSLQIKSIFDEEATIIPVSSIRYSNGMLKDKKIMIKKSNIPSLEKLIKEISDNVMASIQETRKNRLTKQYDSLIKRLNSKVQNNKLEISKQKNEQYKYVQLLNKDLIEIKTTLKNMYQRLGV